jgi:hypothetical protein
MYCIRYANHPAKIIEPYAQGLSGPEVVWADRKYHRHQTVPPSFAADLKNSYKQYLTKLEVLDCPIPLR